jgi:hypothetical protein
VFYSVLNEKGRSGFVMANSASDARASEQDLRKQLIEARAVDVMVAVGPNFFYTVTLPCTLWFLDRGKDRDARGTAVLPHFRDNDRTRSTVSLRAPESVLDRRGESPLQAYALRPVTDCNCVAAMRGGEQQEVNVPSVR